jgi:CRISPR-associated protein Cas1
MDDQTRKVLLVAYQKRKQEEIQHPFLGEKVTVGLLPHVQAMLMARYLRGDLDGYPPFVWK